MVNASSRSSAAAARLDGIVALALGAQQVALADDLASLDAHLQSVEPDLIGFAVEGSAMGLTVLDHRTPATPSRVDRFLAGPWSRFSPLMHAGVGLGLADLGEPVLPWVTGRDDLDAGFAIDGYAFHLALAAPADHLGGQPAPADLTGAAARCFDHGLARAAWFASAADPAAVGDVVARFAPARRADVWKGVGLAATYAGGLDPAGLDLLRGAAGPDAAALAAGSAVAAYVRVMASNVVAGNVGAISALTGRSPEDAAALVRRCRDAADGEASLDAFVRWQDAICQALRDV